MKLPKLTRNTLADCIRVRRELEQIPYDQLTDEQREWLEFVSFKLDDWNSDFDI